MIKKEIVTTRRGNGEGTEIKSKVINGVTYYTWQISYTDTSGEKQRKTITRKNRTDVVLEKKQILKDIANQETVTDDNMTLKAWL